jgi:hypothetical protein
MSEDPMTIDAIAKAYGGDAHEQLAKAIGNFIDRRIDTVVAAAVSGGIPHAMPSSTTKRIIAAVKVAGGMSLYAVGDNKKLDFTTSEAKRLRDWLNESFPDAG